MLVRISVYWNFVSPEQYEGSPTWNLGGGIEARDLFMLDGGAMRVVERGD